MIRTTDGADANRGKTFAESHGGRLMFAGEELSGDCRFASKAIRRLAQVELLRWQGVSGCVGGE